VTAGDAGVGERERLLKTIHAATFYDEDGSEFGTNALNDEAEEQLADAILAAGFGDVAEVRAERDAAFAVIADMREWGDMAGVEEVYNPPTAEDFWWRLSRADANEASK
jgi:hypothetical protein